MRRALKITILIIPLLLVTGVFFVSAKNDSPRGTIRGGVYLDADGDGQCGPLTPVPNIDILLVNGNNRVTLHTGANGTFGLPAAGHGTWRVTANPDPSIWTVTSANPLLVTVFDNEGLIQTGVNFCVSGDGPVGAPSSSTVTSSSSSTTASSATSSRSNSSDATRGRSAIENELASNHSVSSELLSASATFEAVENVAEVATIAPPSGTEWLDYLNLFRDMAGLPRFTELESLTQGSLLHSKYMVLNDKPIAHNEDEANPLFDPAGRQAAINGNIFATSQIQADHVWSTNFWISAPFHLMAVINPNVDKVGYGRYNQEIGQFHMAAVLDIRSELGNVENGVQYPIYFPGDGTETWVVRRSLYEWPDPLGSCPGYSAPTGPALILQLGDGSLTPKVESHAVYQGTKLIESCAYNETTYVNPDPFAQQTGRTIIGSQDAIIIIPKNHLPINETFTVQVTVDGEPYEWSFSTRKGPPE